MPVITRLQLRHDTAASWASVNPTLAPGEAGVETDTFKLKVGNGTQAWNSLAYIAGGSGGGGGDPGPPGPTGATGATGATGPAGPGVPVGGSAGQLLSKINATDYNTQWIAAPSTVPADGTITPAKLANADFGVFTVASGVATLDDLSVGLGKLALNSVGTGNILGGNVLNSKLASMPTMTVKGNPTGLTDVPIDMSAAQTRSIITSDSGGGTTNFLRADGTWAAPPAGGGGGDMLSVNNLNDVANKATARTNLAVVSLAAADVITGQKTFGAVGDVGKLRIAGVTSGAVTVEAQQNASGVLTLPPGSDVIVGVLAAQGLQNKTLTSCTITAPAGLVKGDVGLGNVDNTADVNKPLFSTSATTRGLVPGSNGAAATSFLNATGAWSTPSAGGSGDMTLAGVQTVTGAKTFGAAGNDQKLALAGVGSGSLVLRAQSAAAGILTLPNGGQGDVVARDSTDTLTNKTIALGSNTVSGTLAQLNTAVTDADVPAALNGLTGVWQGTQAQYDAIGTKVSTVLYAITA